jgi:hypothetical protein
VSYHLPHLRMFALESLTRSIPPSPSSPSLAVFQNLLPCCCLWRRKLIFLVVNIFLRSIE